MIKAALVEWIGSQAGAQSPRDIVAWAVDKDLMETSRQSMDVRLLINKRQLDSLRSILKDVLNAGRTATISGDDFFETLQATAATATREPDRIGYAESLAQAGMIPEFLQGLPYRSRLMDITDDLWHYQGADWQNDFLLNIETKIRAYETLLKKPDIWIPLNKGDDPDEHVYPVSLELLP